MKPGIVINLPSKPKNEATSTLPQFLTTQELANAFRLSVSGIKGAVYRHGHWCGIRPLKFASGGKSSRLLWPLDEVHALVARAYEGEI